MEIDIRFSTTNALTSQPNGRDFLFKELLPCIGKKCDEIQAIKFDFSNTQIKTTDQIFEYILNIMDYGLMDEKIEQFEKIEKFLKDNKDLIIFDFTNATFADYISFDYLECNKLIFKNTVFQNGAKLRHMIVNHVLFEPKELNSKDVNFSYSIFGTGELAESEVFAYRHQLSGDAFTYFVNVDFRGVANFSNAILDNVHFGSCNLENCKFLNSKIDKTRFLSCSFAEIDDKKVKVRFFETRWSYFQRLFILFISMGLAYLLYILDFVFLNILFMAAVFLSYFNFTVADTYNWIMLQLQLDRRVGVKDESICFQNYVNNNSFFKNSKYDEITEDLKEFIPQPIEDLDEETFISHNQDFLKMELNSIKETYEQLQVKFSDSGNFQLSGDFFYSKRYIQLVLGEKKTNRENVDVVFLNFHYLTNGFGEKPLRAFVWLLLCFILFTIVLPAKGNYLWDKEEVINYSLTGNAPDSFKSEKVCVDECGCAKGYLTGEVNDRSKVTVSILHTASRLVSPISLSDKSLFKEESKKSLLVSGLASVVLWYFTLAFSLAIWHRIKR